MWESHLDKKRSSVTLQTKSPIRVAPEDEESRNKTLGEFLVLDEAGGFLDLVSKRFLSHQLVISRSTMSKRCPQPTAGENTKEQIRTVEKENCNARRISPDSRPENLESEDGQLNVRRSLVLRLPVYPLNITKGGR